MPDYPLTQQYPTGLEDVFTVVWWDQRGAALSFDPHIAPGTMTIEQFISDTIAVTDYLRDRFRQDRIYLLGHSWGSFIALQAAARSPERYKVYLGMAQMVYQLESEKIAYDYMLAAYRERGDTAMVRRLQAAPVSMTTGTPGAYLKLRDKAMHRLGIGTTHDNEISDLRDLPCLVVVPRLHVPGEAESLAGPVILPQLRAVGPVHLDRPPQDCSGAADPGVSLGR